MSSSMPSALPNLHMIKPLMEQFGHELIPVIESEVVDPRDPKGRRKLPGYMYIISRTKPAMLSLEKIVVAAGPDYLIVYNSEGIPGLQSEDHLKLAVRLHDGTQIPVRVYAYRFGANSGYECVLQLGIMPKETLRGQLWRWLTTQFSWMRRH